MEKLAKINSLEELPQIRKKYVEVLIGETIREMVYHKAEPTRKNGIKRTFFSRTDEPNSLAQFIINDEQINFKEGKIIFKKPYEENIHKKKANHPEDYDLVFLSLDNTLIGGGL